MSQPVRLLFGVVALLACVVVLTQAHAAATLDGDIDVASVTCEDGNITGMELRVTYHGDEPVTVTPHAWGGKQHVQFPWTPDLRLQPGTQTVEIAPVNDYAVLRGSAAQVYLVNGSQRMIESFQAPQCATQTGEVTQ